MVLKEYSGNAPTTRLASGLAQGATVSFAVIAGGGTGYPTGASAPFVVVIDPDTAFEEKILVTTRSGDVFQTLTRGYDNTTDQDHAGQAEVKHVWDAISATEASTHVNDDALDHHSQYLNTTRHDLVARHGVAILPVGATGSHVAAGNHTHAAPSTGTPVATGDANAAGSGTDLALANHIHKGVVANDAWTNFTPVLRQSSDFDIDTINYSHYVRLGRMIIYQGSIIPGASPGSGQVMVTVPVAPLHYGYPYGYGCIYDASQQDMHCGIIDISTGNWMKWRPTAVNTFNVRLGDANSGFTAPLSDGSDYIEWSVMYPAAS